MTTKVNSNGQDAGSDLETSLNCYESSLHKFKDERDAIQKKTFTKWVNKHLKKAGKRIEDLFEDLRDGHNLTSLLEVLSGSTLPRERGRMRFHMLHNVQISLDFLKFHKIKLVNIRPEDIVDGNPKLTLGLIWTIILHFQISDIIAGKSNDMTAREALLLWSQRTTDGYPGVKIRNFTTSWSDGSAFNAIIHRNRPDLIDWHSVKKKRARENLDTAFHVMEKEYAVTRLLDPEDVDTPEPDEKSMITYISSLYDIFPEPPSRHPLHDSEKMSRIEEYRSVAESLVIWIRNSLRHAQTRNFPNTLIEMKTLLTESNKFRVEEVPPRLREKSKCAHLYKELKRSLKESELKMLEDDLHIDNIEHLWERMHAAHKEKDRAIQDEIARLERLQRIAEKLHREAKQCDSRLDEVERKIAEEEKRMDRLHPLDAKRNCDLIERELKNIEDNIKSMFQDCKILREGRYHQAADLHRRISQIHDRWSDLHIQFKNRLLGPLSQKSFPIEEKVVKRETKVVTEKRLVETNPDFKFLQECIEWVQNKLKYLEEAEYGSDLPSVQKLLNQHQTEHKLIDQFQKNIDQCLTRRSKFSGEELNLYNNMLMRLERGYSELLVMSNKRLSDLETLLDYIQTATSELMWLNEKEDTEVTRDWSARNLKLVEIEQYQEQLMNEMEKREPQFNAVQERGEDLVIQKHPASKCIEAYMAAMQTQWAWLLQLLTCLETHLKHSSAYHQFFKEANECEQWISRVEEKLNTKFSRQHFSLDEGEKLMKEMQELREDLTRYGEVVMSIVDRSKEIVPLKQRRQPLQQPTKVTAICNYKQSNINLVKGAECVLHDNSQRNKWKVVNKKGAEALIPGVAFVIPPPNKEAIDLANSLKRHYDATVTLWTKKQRKLRQNMIFATIKVIKGWDLATFKSMAPEQREAIWRALNEDAEKVLAEGDPKDPDLKRLRKELDECNRLFRELQERADAEEANKNASELFNDQASALQKALIEAEKILQSRTQASIPRNLDTLETMVLQHKEFENNLQSLEGQVIEMQVTFKRITKKSQSIQQRHDTIVKKWEDIWSISHIYVERLKCVEIALNDLEEATQVVSNIETALANYQDLPNDLDSLKHVHERILDIQNEVQRQQPVIDQLNDDVVNVRSTVQKSRPKQRLHSDVDKMEDDIRRLIARWNNINTQVPERLRSIEAASELLKKYADEMEAERARLAKAKSRIDNLKPLKQVTVEEIPHEVDTSQNLYAELKEQKPSIDQMNQDAERLIREAKLAIEERYRLCTDNIADLMDWITSIERDLARQDEAKEDLRELIAQIEILKVIREDLDDHQQPIRNCLDQVREVVRKGEDVLSKEEIKKVQNDSENLKNRYKSARDQCDRLLRKLDTAGDELQKFTKEYNNFVTWLNEAQDTLVEKERSLSDLDQLSAQTSSYRSFASDVIAHQADLRFITISAQKFVDECKDYLGTVNNYRTNLPERYSQIESTDSVVKQKVTEVTNAYQALLARVNKLNDAFSGLADKQRQYNEAFDKASGWLRDTTKQANKLLEEPVGADPKVVQDQLDKIKALSSDIVGTGGRLVEGARQAGQSLIGSLDAANAPEAEKELIAKEIGHLTDGYNQLVDRVNDKSNDLQKALVHSQDIEDGLNRVLAWLGDTEGVLRTDMRPASLIRDRLDDQIQEHRMLQSEIENQRPSIEAVNQSARDLINSSNPRLAKKVETKVKDMNARFEKLNDKVKKRGEHLDDVSHGLNQFETSADRFESWAQDCIAGITEPELSQANLEEFNHKIEFLLNQKNAKKDEFDELIRGGKNLVSKRDVTDTSGVKDRIKALENQWREMDNLLVEKLKLGKSRADQLNAYEALKAKVLEWLSRFERVVDKLEPVALDKDILRRQQLEIKPLVKEHADYAPTIDKVNDLGIAYDAMIRGDESSNRRGSPRKMSSSPSRRSPTSEYSEPERSPSGHSSPTRSPSSSGLGSLQSSGDSTLIGMDASPVQQQLTEINNRYSAIGSKLNDRHKEIDKLNDEIKKYLDTIKNLQQFAQNKMKMIPKDSLPGSKEEADRQARLMRTILDEMQDKQPDVDRVKVKGLEIVKDKPLAPGASELKDAINDLTGTWDDLKDACKDRLKYLDDLKDFHDTHGNIANWLNQKDKMMGVLGPIASEPRMVENQLQQVQVMRDEFDAQKPQLESMNNLGHSVIDKCDEPNGRNAKKIDEQMNNVNNQWDKLMDSLDDREKNLGAASSAAKDFHDQLNKLQNSLQDISNDFDKQAARKDNDTKDQLEKLDELEGRLENQRPLLAEAASMCDHLCDILTDPASKNDIRNRMNGIEKFYGDLLRKIDDRKAELESSMKEDKEFHQFCDDIQRWMHDMTHALTSPLKISADKDILKRQVQEYEPTYKEVLDKEHEVHILLNKGNEMVSKLGRSNDAQSLKGKLENYRKQWEKIRKDATDRHTRLQSCYEICKKFHYSVENFVPWLEQAEDKLNSMQPISLKKKELDKQMKELQLFKNDLSKHSQEHESIQSSGQNLMSACDTDKDVVKNLLSLIKRRWDDLNNAILERAHDLEDTANKLNNYQDNVRDLQHSLGRCEDKLSSHDALGNAGHDAKLLQRMKNLQDEAEGLRKQLDHVKDLADGLISDASPATETAHIRNEVDDLDDRFNKLIKGIDGRCADLESASHLVDEFKDHVKSVNYELSALEEELETMHPIGRDLDTVNSQMDEMKLFLRKVEKAHDDVEDLDRNCKDIIKQGYTSDTRGVKDQVESLKRQLNKLDDKAKHRERDIDSMLNKLENFYDSYRGATKDLDYVISEEKAFKPVGVDVDTIKAQQQEFKQFKKQRVEPLGRQIDQVNKTGQGLVISASPGVSVGGLENDLDYMNSEYDALKEKLHDRERKLDIALLQCGKFQDALNGLLKWLEETEDMVANQKPPSADCNVVKAQLQEQKFLKRLLLDRQGSMNSLFAMGAEVAANTDASEKAHIDRQLEDLMDRFNKLDNNCSERMDLLERCYAIAKKYQGKVNPLVDWLDNTEKKLTAMEVIPTDEKKIRKKIKEHEALHDDIMDHKRDFEELNDIAEQLLKLVGDDEGRALVENVEELTNRYAGIVQDSEALGRLLQEGLEGLGAFTLNLEDLLAWIQEMESRLSRYKILSVYVDKLQEQLDEITELTEEIADHQKNVDDVVSGGHELMKHSSGNEAIFVKEKLDTLLYKFNDLSNRATDLLHHAQEALPLAQTFHSNHGRLCDWMDTAERVIKSLDQINLNQQETSVHKLEGEITENRPLLDTVNHVGPQLCQTCPGEGATYIEDFMHRDNRRFDAICEQVQRKAERIELSKQRSDEVLGDIDDLLDWFRSIDKQMQDAEPITPDPYQLEDMLREQKALNEEVSSQKGRARDIFSAAKKLIRQSPHGDVGFIKEKVEDLKDTIGRVSSLCSDRTNALEQALQLANHFIQTHNELVNWLDEMEREAQVLESPAHTPDQIRKLQEKNKAMMQSIKDHTPLVDKLNKTGVALMKLCSDDEAAKVQEIMDSDNSRFNDLKNCIRDRQNALEAALQETSQFADKLDGMLNALNNTADQVNNAEPISAHPQKIQEQIDENNAIIEDLEKRSSALEAVKRAANDVINKAKNKNEPAVKDIKKKLNKLNDLWKNIQDATNKRGQSLEDALDVAEKFWDELNGVMKALTELQDSLNSQEPPAVEPSAIRQQKDVLEEIKQEIDQTKPEVDHCRATGQNLMKLCGEPDKPEVKKHIEELDNAWDNVTTLYARREQNLIDAMEKAMGFHDTLQKLLEFLDNAEDTFSSLGPLGSDIDAVKGQIAELKDFKGKVDPNMVLIEALNRQANELTEHTTPDQAMVITEPVSEVNRRWDDLCNGIVDRQRELEKALLRLGQFQHALNELFAWMNKTEKHLDDLKPVFGDPQVIEVELAKHKVLMNDIQAHQTSVDTLNRAGQTLIEEDRGTEDASKTQKKLNELNSRWSILQDKAAIRQQELENSLAEAQAFSQEIQDLLMWLSDIDGQLVTSKPVGGLPETAREQLQRFMEVYNELDSNRHKVESVLQQGQEYLKRSTDGASSGIQHSLRTLKQKWDSAMNKANDRKIKLEIALREATEFHEALQDFVEWLTSAEKHLANLKPVSRVMESLMEQIEEHKSFQKDVGSHREVMLNLDKKGTHLKYFSQKQDVILIKNLLISVQHRWERVVSKSAERTRSLDHGYKEAKEFHDAWSDMMKWLTDSHDALEDMMAHVGNDPVKIKEHLAHHKQFQRALGAKQNTYDNIIRMGRLLKDKAPKSDVPILQSMMDELKNKWNMVCSKSVDRQRKLEEALLFSGQFKEAMDALLEWLNRVEKQLKDDQPVFGDLDTVTNLIEQHKTFQNELEGRAKSMDSVKNTAEELLKTAEPEDAANIRKKLDELTDKWDTVSDLCDRKSERLSEALKQAEKLHQAVHMLLEWLSDAEMKLRFSGPLPEDEETTLEQIQEHKKFMREMAEQEGNKDATIAHAQEILQKCHPDAVSVIKHWITIIQSRWDEVTSWAKSRHQKLEDHLEALRELTRLMDELMRWLQRCEDTLTTLEAEPLPDELDEIERLIKDHQDFMDDLTKRQPEVEKVTKTKRPPTQKEGASSPRHRNGRITSPYDKTHGPKGAVPKTSTPAKNANEPQIKNPKARALFDKWRHVWLLAMERQRRLLDKLKYLKELEKMKNFSWDDWRRRYMRWNNHKKTRVMDFFRKMDKDNDGKLPREDFIEGILKSKFPTSKMEMEAVADLFDRNGYIDILEFINALRPERENNRPKTDDDKVYDEVTRQVAQCTCRSRFKVLHVGEGKYRFGDSQKLRLVRILRSTVMVRVGGGWVALDEFLVKNDPCRAKGRTNIELREKFILASGVSQSMTPFKSKSPNSSVSSQSGTKSDSLPRHGPITKIREKTARSIPLSKRAGETSSDISGPSFGDNDSGISRSRLQTPGSGRGSRPNSRPPSRASSDLSQDSVDVYRGRTSRTVGSHRRTPSNSSTGSRGKTQTKIPTIRTPSKGRQNGNADSLPRWH